MYCHITRPDVKAKMDDKRRTTVAVEWRVNILGIARVAGLLAGTLGEQEMYRVKKIKH